MALANLVPGELELPLFLLAGERKHRQSADTGKHHCGVCKATRSLEHVVETRYFCLFGVRLLPIEREADYLECTTCQHGFHADNTEIPSYVSGIHVSLAYLLLGFGLHEHARAAGEVCERVSGTKVNSAEIHRIMGALDRQELNLEQELSELAATTNDLGKYRIIQAAFLMTHMCCEPQQEDRVRINLMGTALGVGLEFVHGAIEDVRSQHYSGLRRLSVVRHVSPS